MAKRSIALKALRQVQSYANASVDTIPVIDPDLLKDLAEIFDENVNKKEISYVLATLLIYGRKTKNKIAIAASKLYSALEKEVCDNIDPEEETMSHFLKLVRSLLDNEGNAQIVLTETTSDLFRKVLKSRDESSVEELSNVIATASCSDYLGVFLSEHNKLVESIAECVLDNIYSAFLICACACRTTQMCQFFISKGVLTKALGLLKSNKSFLSDPNVLMFITYMAENEIGAEKIIESGYLEEGLIYILKKPKDVDTWILGLHARITNLLTSFDCFARYKGYDGDESSDIRKQLVTLLTDMGEMVIGGEEEYSGVFVELVYSLSRKGGLKKLLVKDGVVDSLFVVAANNELLNPFIPGSCDRMMVMLRRTGGYEMSERLTRAILSTVSTTDIQMEPWRFFIYMLFIGLHDKTGVGRAISKGLEKTSNPDARLFNAVIYAAAMAYAFVNPTQGHPMLEYVPERFITTIQEQVADNGGFVGSYGPSRLPDFSFSLELPEGNCKISDFILELAPHVLFACSCAALEYCLRTGNTSHLNIAEQYKYIEDYFLSEDTSLLDIHLVKFLCLLAKKGAVKHLGAENVVKFVTRALEAVKDEEDFCACCDLVNEFVLVKENKPIFSNKELLVGLKELLDSNYKDSERCCIAVNKVLWIIATDTTGKTILTDISMLDNVIGMLAAYKENESLVHSGLKTFWSLIMKNENRDKAFAQGGVGVIGDIIKLYALKSPSITNSAFTCIKIFSQVPDDDCGDQLIKAKVIDNAVRVAKGPEVKVGKTALQAIYSCFAFTSVQKQVGELFDGLGEMVKGNINDATKISEDVHLALKLVRVFSSSEVTAGKVVESGLLESVLTLDERVGHLSPTVYEMLLQILAKLASRKKAASYLDSDDVIKMVSRALASASAQGSTPVMELVIKLIYSYASYSADNLKTIKSMKLDKELKELAGGCDDAKLVKLVKKITEGNIKSGSVDFPRTPSRADF